MHGLMKNSASILDNASPVVVYGILGDDTNTLPLRSSDKEREAQLASFVSRLVSECSIPDNASPVVVYGNPGEETDAQVQWLADRLGRLKQGALAIAVLGEPPGTAQVGNECDGVSRYDPMTFLPVHSIENC